MKTHDDKRKIHAARLSVLAALFLSLLKVSAGFLFQSLGMISAGVDSLMDLISSAINYFSMKKSVKPADSEHPYGHGKIENIASLLQALILGLMGLFLIGEGARQTLHDRPVPDFDMGILVMVFSGLVSFAVGRRLLRIGRETDSPLLEVDSFHYTMDTYTNAGVVIALMLAKWKEQIIFDRIIAIIIGGWILISAYRIFRSSLDVLMDKYLPIEVQEQIQHIILSHSPEIMGYHKLRSRRAGSQKLIDLHLVTCKERSLSEAHKISDHIEKEIEERIRNSDVIIHIEPCNKKCPHHLSDCEFISKTMISEH